MVKRLSYDKSLHTFIILFYAASKVTKVELTFFLLELKYAVTIHKT